MGRQAMLRWMALMGAVVATACTPTAQPTPTTSLLPTPLSSSSSTFTPIPTAAGTPGPSTAALRPVVIDTDMAPDDVIAIAVLLRDPAVDVRAITVTGTGEAHCLDGTRNAHRLLEAFALPDIPVGCGPEATGPNGRLFPGPWRDNADQMFGLSLPPAVKTETSPSDELLKAAAEDATAAGQVLTIVALGPWTSLAEAISLHPSLATASAIRAMGGALYVDGNVVIDNTTAADGVEWNIGVDPDADAAVLASAIPITLVPLDATNYVPVAPGFKDELGTDHAAAGADITYEMMTLQPYMTDGSWYIWDPLAALTVSQPNLVTWQDINVEVHLTGAQAGRLVPGVGRPIKAAVSANADAVFDALFAALRTGAALP